jgi:nicotinate-nucleotide pyrophosphorylase (carboxylating)
MISPAYLTEEAIHLFIRSALAEDIGEGDHSSLGAIPRNTPCKARLLVKDEGVIAGLSLAEKIFQQVDPALQVTYFKHDGDLVHRGDVAFEVTGQAQSILSAERLVLNCMQRMSGIATHTKALCQLLEGTSTKLLDTRKTTPNFRAMEKWAVAIGGGQNHRFALYDMVMLKDNHVDFAGGITQALTSSRDYLQKHGLDLKIEIETRNLAELQEALDCGLADIIMLDNYPVSELVKAVEMVKGKIPLEASGNVTEETIVRIAETGVDFISVGALTHSYKSLDLSLKAKK